MNRGSGGSSRHFAAYGGPANGELVGVRPGALRYSRADPTHVQGVRYSYILVDAPNGGKVFVPEDDQCLRRAFLNTSGEPGDRETETLAAEIQRRGLNV